MKETKKYPEDTGITTSNAMLEMAKDFREMRNFFRSIPQTDAGRPKTASWITGKESWENLALLRDIMNILMAMAKQMGINGLQAELEKARMERKNRGQKEKLSKTQNSPS